MSRLDFAITGRIFASILLRTKADAARAECRSTLCLDHHLDLTGRHHADDHPDADDRFDGPRLDGVGR